MQTRRRKKKDTPSAVTASGEPPEHVEDPHGSRGRPEAVAAPVGGSSSRPGTRGNGEIPRLPVAWGNIVADALKIKDPAGLARRLRSELELGEHARSQYGSVLEALDRSARNFDAAGRLFRASKLEESTFEAQVAVRLETMRSSALGELMGEYRAKSRPSPTQRDIEDRMIQSWPDEYTGIKQRQAELHGAVRSLEILQNAWASRSADVRIMADKARPIR